ncbi:MAG TPA: DUF5667 domain-containing protein, partial [Anaerolineaceae bacterium]|nr:DUF5667 domain-containing protein [Anaerolineaceae bacterium]
MNKFAFDLENTLETCLRSMDMQVCSLEDCLTRHPNQREQLEPILRLALKLRGGKSVTASETFRQVAWQRMTNLIDAYPLPSAAQTIPSAPDVHKRRVPFDALFLRRTWGPVALVVLIVIGMLTTLQVSAHALPGDVLYPIKLNLEKSRLSLSQGGLDRAENMLNLTDERVDELIQVVERHPDRHVEEAVREIAGQLDETLTTVHSGHKLTEEEQKRLLDRLQAGLDEHEAALNKLLEKAQLDPVDQRLVEDLVERIRQARDEIASVIPLPQIVPTLKTFNTPPAGWPTWSFPVFEPKFTPSLKPVHPSGTPSPTTAQSKGQPTPDETANQELQEMITEWPTEWPTLEITPEPDP